MTISTGVTVIYLVNIKLYVIRRVFEGMDARG